MAVVKGLWKRFERGGESRRKKKIRKKRARIVIKKF